MRRLIVLVAALIAFTALTFAQDEPTAPKAELFIGYNLQHTDLSNESLGTANLSGANVQGTAFLHKNLGITADISNSYGSDVLQSGENVRRYTYLFGPTYALHTQSNFTPYVHALFGVDHERVSVSNLGDFTDNSFAYTLGGGIDVKLVQHVALRPAQLDFLHTDHGSVGQNNFRYSAGVVFKF
jgi:opacity protein-like surface antigen